MQFVRFQHQIIEMELQIIQNKIFEIRGQRVMLDFDIANLYEVETRVLNQAVKRNIKRFPSDFMFQLSNKEFDNLMSQSVISSWGGTRKLPYVFTEHGVTMLASVLRSERAIAINIQIVRAFIALCPLGFAAWLAKNTHLAMPNSTKSWKRLCSKQICNSAIFIRR